MVKALEFQKVYQELLSSLYGNEEAKAIFYLLAQHYHGLSKTQISLGATLSDDCFLRHALQELQKGKPVQYIMGNQVFMGLEINVKAGVLIPRPETEELVQMILDRHSSDTQLRVIDLCTGSGCIALALKHFRPQLELHASDISSAALAIAHQNAQNLNLQVQFHSFDLLHEWPKNLEEPFDIIVSNPPYVLPSEANTLHPNVLSYEPHIALFSPEEDGLGFYKRIAQLSDYYLKPEGALYLELNPMRAKETLQLFQKPKAQLVQDLSGKKRFLMG